jgi:Tol biopolymer transport system component/DNA-binding winged helix-turn-helix (wHTH) protein
MSGLSPVRFSVFEVDLRNRELRKHGIRLKLQDQPFRVLQALVERPGELVSREELQRRIWGGDTFVDFDQSLNRAVNKLREALGDGAGTPRFIETLPRRGYRFIAPVEGTPHPASETTAAGKSYRSFTWAATGLLLAAGAGLWSARNQGTLPPPRVVPLTTFTGTESHPAFSPDGKQVAFAWSGEKQDNTDVYVKVIGEPEALRLTSDPAFDGYPAWSPDGRQIAFASTRGEGGVYLVSALGGPERKLADLATNSRLAWSPDGKFLLVAKHHRDTKPEPGDGALFQVPVDREGEPREILTPPRGTWFKDPAYAPRGRSLAYASCTGSITGSNCSLQVVGSKEGLIPSGEPRRITEPSLKILGLAWTVDGSSLIYSSQAGNQLALLRVSVRNGKEPERVELAGTGASYPAIDFKTGRLAFSRRLADDDIWRLERGGKACPFLTSSRSDLSPQYSADGRRIAFASGREGENREVWVANADGTGLTRVTRMSVYSGTPRWSPDGQWIAFDARKSGWDIWVAEANGGSSKQLTRGPADSVIPSWSRDGSSIYFASNRSGRFEIWRMPAHGGAAEQITRHGGYVAFDSTDGKTLYYTLSSAGTEGLYAKQLPNGEEKQLLNEGVERRGFAVFSDGVYYVHSRGSHQAPEDALMAPFQSSAEAYDIRFYEFASGRIRVVAQIEGPLHLGLTVSPDRKTFLFSRTSDLGSDLMLIENFQ